MDYNQFFAEVSRWVYTANDMAGKHGLDSESFWQWVTGSAADICERYGNHPLVLKQMMMLSEWLEEVYLQQRKQVTP